MNPWINYHHLYYFKAIAEDGSVSRAAERLRLGQPTLSAQLKQLEESLGVALFERRNKKLILTEHGKVALNYARSIFSLGSEMYEVLHDRLVPNRVSLHLGAIDSVAKQLVVRLVERALAMAPCQISLSEGKMDELVRELSAHRIDLLLTNHLPSNQQSKNLFHKRITKENVSVYAAPKFKKLRVGFPQSISGQPFILPNYESRLRYDFDHWCKLEGLVVDVIAEGPDIAVKKLLAVNGVGLLPAAEHTVHRQVLAGDLIKIGTLRSVFEQLYLISADRRVANPIGAKLLKTFKV
ncbi:MAG: LysR family transcriptional regulator [Bdellovibrionota bacterium]